MDFQGALIGSQRGPGRPLGGLLGAFWRLRKRLRSDSLQYAKTFKFAVRYCKIRGPEGLNPFKFICNFDKNRLKIVETYKLNNILLKIGGGAAKMEPGSSTMSSGGGRKGDERVTNEALDEKKSSSQQRTKPAEN